MKKTLLLIIMAFFANANITFAQEYKQEAELIQSIMGKAKKDFVKDLIDIPAGSEETFWSFYNDYEARRQELAGSRLQLIKQYANMWGSDNQREYKNLVADVVALNRQGQNSIKKYYNKISKKVSPKTAMQFFQVEEYIRTKIDNKLYENLPITR